MLRKDFLYKGLMRYFEDISSIPRPTFYEEKIAKYLCDFAKDRGLEYYCDKNHNVLIKKAGSQGRENESPILLQGHSDMVCEKNANSGHDFLKDGLNLYEKDGWLRAKDTTLGADNGVAVASMLYILDGAEGYLKSHPPIECLFTSAEEVGLVGAEAFDYSKISARKMINMDSADESQIICGCAGGQRSTVVCDLITERAIGTQLELTVKGLAGGHSGEDINRSRANANKLMGRILQSAVCGENFGLVSINGGTKDNAIPRECVAFLCVQNEESFVKIAKDVAKDIEKELCYDDNAFEFSISKVANKSASMICPEQTRKIIFFMATVQNGVIEMNRDVEGLVDFSRNLGIVYTDEPQTRMEFTFMARSPKKSQIRFSGEQLENYAEMLGMRLVVESEYPGWDFAKDSEIRNVYSDSYNQLYGKNPTVIAIHAGLECGIIKEKVPDMDIISCGPIVLDLHSPDEKLNIESFEHFFSVIIKTLERI